MFQQTESLSQVLPARLQSFYFQNQVKYVLDTLVLQILIFIMYIPTFWGDLTDLQATTNTLSLWLGMCQCNRVIFVAINVQDNHVSVVGINVQVRAMIVNSGRERRSVCQQGLLRHLHDDQINERRFDVR